MVNPALLAKAASVLSNEKTRKAAGWAVAAVLSPVILLIAFFCSLGAGGSSHNVSMVQLCFNDGTLPAEMPEEYRICVEEMRESLMLLDKSISEVNREAEEGKALDALYIKSVFYTLYFGREKPAEEALQQFLQCFFTGEERTRTLTFTDDSGEEYSVEQTYTFPTPVTDMDKVSEKLAAMGLEVPADLQGSADSICNLLRYGSAAGGNGFAGSDVPFIGADGFCSPIGENWRDVVTSEFGCRKDPFTGKTKGHSGMDLAVPTGTSVRAALPGTVTVSAYNKGGYGYYVMVDHGDGLATLYGHCSQLLVQAGQAVEAGDIIALSGSTGRSTGPHLHFEVRINGGRTNPRSYLP